MTTARWNTKALKSKVRIICPKHGPFRQTPDAHLNAKSGCGRCSESKGEKGIAEFLEAIEIEFELHKRFPDCKFKRRLPFDFYLPDYDALIEFDGQQHFERDYSWFKDPALSQKNFEMIQLRDEIKTEWAKTKKISLFRIRFDEDLQKRMCDICEELDIQI